MRIAIAALVLAWLGVLSCYDIRERRLPNALTLPGAGVILLDGAVAGRGLAALAGAAALAAVLSDPARFAGKKVAVVCSGGNISPAQLAALWPDATD